MHDRALSNPLGKKGIASWHLCSLQPVVPLHPREEAQHGMDVTFDAIVVGGGPAGLSAALVLGRCRRRTLVCDKGEYRNRSSAALHGFLGRDGSSPGQLLAEARTQLQRYPQVMLEESDVLDIRKLPDKRFAVRTHKATHITAGVLIATGTEDQLPDVPGLAACYGISAHVCPYCDGWENRDAPIAVLGEGEKATAFACLMQQWSADLVLCTNGSERLSAAAERTLQSKGIAVVTQAVSALEAEAGHLKSIVFQDGSRLARQALFLSAGQKPRDGLLRSLGCEVGEHGVVCNPDGITCVPGVLVAGDVSRDVQLAVIAAAEGGRAAVALDRHLRTQGL